jgi:hypothetical protein
MLCLLNNFCTSWVEWLATLSWQICYSLKYLRKTEPKASCFKIGVHKLCSAVMLTLWLISLIHDTQLLTFRSVLWNSSYVKFLKVKDLIILTYTQILIQQ